MLKRLVRPLSLVLLVLGLAGGAHLDEPGVDAQSSEDGQWSAPFAWPTVAIHNTLLPTGKILSYSYPIEDGWTDGAAESWLWDPTTSQFTEVPVVNGTNIFCSGHALLSDGQVVSFGGTDPDSPLPTFWGQKEVNKFNTSTGQWSFQTSMTQARWYPSITTLSDGKLLIASGLDETGWFSYEFEVYDPATGTTTQLPASADRFTALYSWNYLLPNGRILSAGNGNDVASLNLSNNTWSAVDGTNFGTRDQGTSVLLPLKASNNYRPEVLIMGGSDGSVIATNTAERIDMGAPIPVWTNADNMHYARRHANSLLLPDGTVLVTGGTTYNNEPADAIYAAEIYDPAANTFTEMASAQRPRIYHSTSLLLPDGRVLVGGTDGEMNAEIYSPPYLFNGSRPTISGAPAAVAWGSAFQVTTPDAADITKVMLMKPSSVTHSVNMGQRAIQLGFTTQGSGALNVTAPPNGRVAPPGHYMMFIVNADGVPSVAGWVHVSGAPPITPTPTPSPTPSPTPTPTPTPTPSPTPTPTPTPAPPADADGDGYLNSTEDFLGTDADTPCGPDWPSNIIDTGASANKLDLQDVLSFVVPVRRLDGSPGPGSPYDPRWDLTPGPTIPFTGHINIVDITTLTNGVTGHPPMFGGESAFNRTCSDP
jgi:hypothetical protein